MLAQMFNEKKTARQKWEKIIAVQLGMKHQDNFYSNWTSEELFSPMKITGMEEFNRRSNLIETMNYKIIDEARRVHLEDVIH